MVKRLVFTLCLQMLIVFFAAGTAIPAADLPVDGKGKNVIPIKKTTNIEPRKAQPKEMPKTVSSKEKVSAGFECDDCDEPTQERPNPLDARKARKINAAKDASKTVKSSTP